MAVVANSELPRPSPAQHDEPDPTHPYSLVRLVGPPACHPDPCRRDSGKKIPQQHDSRRMDHTHASSIPGLPDLE